MILFPLGKVSSSLVPPKPLSGGKISHRFPEGPCLNKKARREEDEGESWG